MIISQITSFYNALETCITNEIGQDGVLWDVETLLTDSYNDEYIELPLIWIEKKEISTGTIGHFSSKDMYLNIPLTFVCCSDEHDDYSTSENESLSIASRVITSLLRNIGESINITNSNYSVRDIRLDSIDPTGTFEIPSKRVIIPGTRVSITFEVSIDWMNYEDIKENEHKYVNFDTPIEIEEFNIEDIDVDSL